MYTLLLFHFAGLNFCDFQDLKAEKTPQELTTRNLVILSYITTFAIHVQSYGRIKYVSLQDKPETFNAIYNVQCLVFDTSCLLFFLSVGV